DPSYDLTIEDLKNFIKNRVKDPLERLILEIIGLSLEEKREAFFEFIDDFEKQIKELTKENYLEYAIILSEKLNNMTREEIEKALNKIVDYSISRREDIVYFL